MKRYHSLMLPAILESDPNALDLHIGIEIDSKVSPRDDSETVHADVRIILPCDDGGHPVHPALCFGKRVVLLGESMVHNWGSTRVGSADPAPARCREYTFERAGIVTHAECQDAALADAKERLKPLFAAVERRNAFLLAVQAEEVNLMFPKVHVPAEPKPARRPRKS